MPREYPKRRKDPQVKTEGTRGFNLGWNTLTHPTTIKNNELSEAQNVFYSQNGVLSKRPGSRLRGLIRGSSTIINGLAGVYDINGQDYLIRISDDGIAQRYSFDTDSWLDISGSPTFSNTNTTILQAYGSVYFLNELDLIRKWNGTSWLTFSPLANPTEAPTVIKIGGALTVSIGNGGSGYQVNDILTITDGDNNCTLKVLTLSGSAVASVEIVTNGTGLSIGNGKATTANPAASRTGCTINVLTLKESGNKTYYYRYVWYNEIGNTLASTAASVVNMPEELDSATSVKVTLPAAPEGTTRVGIFKGDVAGEEIYMASVPASQTTYEDKGYDEDDPLYSIPTSNTTAGFHFKFADVYRNSLIGITTEMGGDTLVFSAGGDKFDSFGRSDGGGYYSWRRDDGDPITGVHAFQDGLYVFKRTKVGEFKFDENGGVVTDINLAVGAVSHRSIHAAGNDLRFWSDQGAMSLGNEPNFANIIRTKVISARADTLVQSLTPGAFRNISGIYYKGISLWGIPTGEAEDGITSTLIYDEKYVAWSEWLGLTPNIWVKFFDSDDIERLYYGDSQSANVVECWQGTTDCGNPIVWRVATKQFDMDRPHQYKTFGNCYFIFGNVSGSATRITLVEDGTRTQIPLALSVDTGNQGFGVDQWGTIQFGETSGDATSETSGLVVRYIDLGNKDLFSLQSILSNNGLNDLIQFMGIFIEYSESAQPLPASKRLTRVQE